MGVETEKNEKIHNLRIKAISSRSDRADPRSYVSFAHIDRFSLRGIAKKARHGVF